MKIEMIAKKNRIIFLITYMNQDMVGKVIIYTGLISDNIIYKKVFKSHSCEFRVSKRDLSKNRIRGK